MNHFYTFCDGYNKIDTQSGKIEYLKQLNQYLRECRLIEFSNEVIDHYGGAINAAEELETLASSRLAEKVLEDLGKSPEELRIEIAETIVCLTEGKQNVVQRLVNQGVMSALVCHLPKETDARVLQGCVMAIVHVIRWSREFRDACIAAQLDVFLKARIQNCMSHGDNTNESFQLLNAMLDTAGVIIAQGPFEGVSDFVYGILPCLRVSLRQATSIFTSCFTIRNTARWFSVECLIESGIVKSLIELLRTADFFVAFDTLQTIECITGEAESNELREMFENIDFFLDTLRRFVTKNQRFETKKVVSILAKIITKSPPYITYNLLSNDILLGIMTVVSTSVRSELTALLLASASNMPVFQFVYFVKLYFEVIREKNHRFAYIYLECLRQVYKSEWVPTKDIIRASRANGFPKTLYNFMGDTADGTLNNMAVQFLLGEFYLCDLKRLSV